MQANHTQLIKDKLSILDVVGSYVTLEQAGKDWKGKSPFTNEKTPSFYVSPDKGFYYCFSSGKGGDIFHFIQEIERVEFREALKILADRAGVNLGSNEQNDAPDSILYTLLDDATRWYEVNLRKNKQVVEYLLGRGLTKETIVKFRIGYAKDSWDDLYRYLKKKNYTEKQIQESGMGVARGTTSYDRFRSRIMFPFRDHRGRVVAFSGRIFTDHTENKEAKYVNSPEGPLFDKSKILFGYDTAKQEIAKLRQSILVEGQFDVIMAQQVGTLNTIAVSGTGLTDDHMVLLKRFAQTLILMFDADAAGIKATRRSVAKVYQHGLNVKVVALPHGQDPADYIKESSTKWQLALTEAQDYLGYRLKIFSREFPEASFEERHNLVTYELFEFISIVPSSVSQEKYLQDIALFLGVPIDSVKRDYEHFLKKNMEKTVSPEMKKQEGSANLEISPNSNGIHSLKISYEEILGLGLLIKENESDVWKSILDDYNLLFFEISGVSLTEYMALFDGNKLAKVAFKYQKISPIITFFFTLVSN